MDTVPDSAVVGIVVEAVKLLAPFAYVYPVNPVTARLVVVKLVNDSDADPGTLVHVVPLNIAQSPTFQAFTPSKFVVPATDTT